jgi:serine/threonine-protein kinase
VAVDSMIPEEQVREALAPNYILERELGRGGMGAVYLARDVRLERPVAIKFLPPELAAREDLRARFLQETRTAASFSHPNIVPVHSIEEREGILCFVMGYVEGETLNTRVKRGGPLTASEATRLLQECAWALSYAHGRGVIHRDVKPDNILLDKGSGRALITDFGIARSQNASAGGGLTMVGELIGTPQYMSPEQATGEQLDRRSDLYSLGVVAFFALTGRLPFESNTAHGYLTAHITKPAPSLGSIRPDLPASLASAVDRLLAKDPSQRFQSGEELAEFLDPLRASRREIPPAIRLFHVKSTQVIRNAIVLVLLAPGLSSGAKGDADQMIFLLMIFAAAVALVFQGIGGLRDLAAQGFTHDDLRNGLTGIAEEESEARARARSTPGWRERRKRQNIRSAIGLVVAIVLIVYALSLREKNPAGGYYSPTIGMISAAVGFMLLMATLVYTIASAGPARIDRKLRGLWTGRIGRKLFETVARQVPAPAQAAGVTSAELGPQTLIEALPKDARREMSEVLRIVANLGVEQQKLVAREMKLTSSQTEATRGSAGVATDTLDRVVKEISDAKIAVSEKRADISAALERIRLELIRYRSGVGSAADVKSEAKKAADLISSN